MPLVTRQANQGIFFKVADEPPDWQNADIWTDTDNSNLAVNRSGTAVQIAPGTLTQGDMPHASTTDTNTSLAIGDADQVLTVNDAGTLPNWETLPPGLTITAVAADTPTATFTTTSNSLVTITGWTITIPDITNGQVIINCSMTGGYTDSGGGIAFTLINDGSTDSTEYSATGNNVNGAATLIVMHAADGSTIIVKGKDNSAAGTATWTVSANDGNCFMNALGMG